MKIIPNIPQTNIGGAAVVNNYYTNRSNVYNLHKIDTKLDYNVTSKLRVSGRFGYQPYYNFQTADSTVRFWAASGPSRSLAPETTCSTAPGWRFPRPEVT